MILATNGISVCNGLAILIVLSIKVYEMNKNTFIRLTTILLSALLISSCNKDTVKPNISASEYFPNSSGDYWEYDVHDSTAGYTEVENYTVKITIAGITKLIDGNDAYVWLYEYPSRNDTNYIRIVGDTVKVFDLIYSRSIRDLQFPREIYIIPFSAEQRWDGKLLLIDSFHVYTAPSIDTHAGVFTNCFNIYHHYLAPNTEFIDNYWFKPNVGMVKISYNHYVLNPRTFRIWNLKKYYLH
jgi:hypothetical protein